MQLQKQGDTWFPYDQKAVEETENTPENEVRDFNSEKATGLKHRSIQQNRLQYKWFRDLEGQGDQTATEYRGYCKLHFGVPLLREVDETFPMTYDRVIRPLSYEDKLALMVDPIELPVTSRMKSETMTKYLNAIANHFIPQKFKLSSLEYLEEWAKDN